MATIDPTKREALQKAYEGILDSKNNQTQVVNVVDYIAGGVIQKIVDMDDLAAASVWLDKLANVTHKNLEEFKNDLTAWPTLGLSKTRNMDEERFNYIN